MSEGDKKTKTLKVEVSLSQAVKDLTKENAEMKANILADQKIRMIEAHPSRKDDINDCTQENWITLQAEIRAEKKALQAGKPKKPATAGKATFHPTSGNVTYDPTRKATTEDIANIDKVYREGDEKKKKELFNSLLQGKALKAMHDGAPMAGGGRTYITSCFECGGTIKARGEDTKDKCPHCGYVKGDKLKQYRRKLGIDSMPRREK